MTNLWRFWRKRDSAEDTAALRLPSEDPAGSSGNEEKLTADGVVNPVDSNDAESPPAAVENLAKRELTVGEGWDFTGFAFSTWRKWSILTSVFIVQISMNYNASAYANAVSGLTEEYGITSFQARLGQMVFLVAYVSWSYTRGRLNVTDIVDRLSVARLGLPGRKNLGDSGSCKALFSWSTSSRSHALFRRTGPLSS